MQRIYTGGHLARSPKKKEQKGFRGFHNEGGKPYTLSMECVQIAPIDFAVMEVRNIQRNSKNELCGFVTYLGRSRLVKREPIFNPSPSEGITYKGMAEVWKLS